MSRPAFVLPDAIRIGRTDYAVHLDATLDEHGLDAFFDRATKQILISSRLRPAARDVALVHEILHALLPDDLDPALEERIVEHLDGPLVRVLRQLRWEEP